MLASILLSLFFLAFPAVVIWLGERRIALVDRIGAVVICYAAGLILGNVGILPRGAAGIQDIVTTAAIPLALPLMFFSLDVREWKRTGGRSILSFGLETVAVLVASAAGYLIFRRAIGGEAYKVAGMLVGVYTGGTINLAAIGTALRVNPTFYVAANTSDIVISAIYLLFLVTVGQRVIGLFLPPFRKGQAGEAVDESRDYGSYKGLFSRAVFLPLLAAFGVAILIAAAGASFTIFLPAAWGAVIAILAITTFSIASSFIPPLRRVKKTYQLGHYFILVFCLAIGSMADLGKLASTMPVVFGYVTLAVFGSLVVHVALARLFKIDTDTMIITSVAGICSPPFVPMVASSLKNKAVVLPGIVTGIIGWVIGTYLGIAFGYLLSGIGL